MDNLDKKECYEWRFCPVCNERIFKDETEGETIKTINNTVYCIDCANEIEQENKNVQEG